MGIVVKYLSFIIFFSICELCHVSSSQFYIYKHSECLAGNFVCVYFIWCTRGLDNMMIVRLISVIFFHFLNFSSFFPASPFPIF